MRSARKDESYYSDIFLPLIYNAAAVILVVVITTK